MNDHFEMYFKFDKAVVSFSVMSKDVIVLDSEQYCATLSVSINLASRA